MSHAEMARALFGMSLGFHIIFATMGVGLPLMVGIAELSGVLTGDSDYAQLAKRWTKGFVVLLGVGVVTGTIVAIQLSLLWPAFMRMVGQVIALPFLIEVFAFFLEALFTAIYMYAGDRVRPAVRIVSAFLVAIGSGLSALLITDVNAFMNTPTGFRLSHGMATDIHPWQAVFNPAMPTEMLHVLVSAYMTVAFVLAAIASFQLLKPNLAEALKRYHEKALMLMLSLGGVMAVLTAIAGDLSGKFLAQHQPIKLAAGEALFHTTSHAPLLIGGIVHADTQQVSGGIELPWLLSFLATGHFDGIVQGLTAFPRDQWPPLIVHWMFDVMVGIGSLCILLAVVGWLLKTRNRRQGRLFQPWFLRILVAAGPLAFIGLESGWLFDEIGRQPWTITGLLLTQDAATSSPNVGLFFIVFMSLYLVLGIGTVVAIRAYFKGHPLDPGSLGTTTPRREVWLP